MSFATELLPPVDAAWFRMEQRRTPTDIFSLLYLDGPPDERALVRIIEERLLTHRRFRRRVVDSRWGILPPRWADAPFRLEEHVRHRSVAAPGDEAALAALLDDLANEPLDFSRSPWRLWVIDGLADGAALVSQLHHCMGDGFALLHLLLSLAERADGSAPEPLPRLAVDGHEGGWLRTLEEEARALGHLLALPFDPPTALRDTLSGRRRLAWTPALSLRTIRDDARAHGATVNDTIMAAIAGALGRYCEDRGEPRRAVRALVPVNLRPPDVPVDEEHGNYFGLVFPTLPSDVVARAPRLRAMQAEMARIKGSKEAVVSLGVLTALGRLPAAVDHLADALFAHKGSVVITNVPGPRTPLVLAGREVRDLVFWAPHPWLGCGVSIGSYAGRVRVGVRTDAAVVPDPERIAAAVAAELGAG